MRATAAAVVVAAIVVWPAASAAQGRFVVSQREEIRRVGTIKDRDVAAALGERLKGVEGFVEAAERARLGGLYAAVGFKYQQTVVGFPLWTSGGGYCVFLGGRYVEIPKSRAAELLGLSEADVRPPFEYRVPLGLIAYPGLIIIGVPVSLLLAKREVARRRRAEQAYLDSFKA